MNSTLNQLLLAIDSTGSPTHWLTWEEAVTCEVLGKIAYGFGDFEFTFRGGINRATGLISEISLKSILVLNGRSLNPFRNISSIPLTNAALFKRDQICVYCGKGPRGLTRDHIVPLSRGGKDSWLNCCACCSRCNGIKGSRLLEELGWELLYVPYVPTHHEGLVLQNRRILSDQMEILKAVMPKHSRILDRSTLQELK